MKIMYPICCGIDVHKKFLIATIVSSKNPPTLTYKKKRFSTFNNQLRELRDWLLENDCHNVCMESTGKYWVPVFNVLEKVLHVEIVNPKWVKAVKGNKDDVKDSKWIGELFCFGLTKSSFIPEKSIRILREFTRYRAKLVATRSSEKNRFQNGFTVCNVALDAVVSDMFGKSASKITDYLLTTDNPDPSICPTFLHASMLKKSEAVVESIEGFEFTDEQKWRMLKVREHYQYLNQAIDDIDSKLDVLTTPFKPHIDLLCTIPGIKHDSAVTILSEIGVDMSQFDSSKRLCSWAGLTPSNNQSAGKKKSVRISRAGVYLKPCLVQVAHAAVKCTEKPYYKNKYERISKRRGKKRAIIAIARMILTAIFHMLTLGERFEPSDLKLSDMTPQLKEKNRMESIKQAINLLKRESVLPIEFSAG